MIAWPEMLRFDCCAHLGWFSVLTWDDKTHLTTLFKWRTHKCVMWSYFLQCVLVCIYECVWGREKERERHECVCKCVGVPGSCHCIRCEGQSAISVDLHLSACLRWVSLGWLTLELLDILLSLSPIFQKTPELLHVEFLGGPTDELRLSGPYTELSLRAGFTNFDIFNSVQPWKQKGKQYFKSS